MQEIYYWLQIVAVLLSIVKIILELSNNNST